MPRPQGCVSLSVVLSQGRGTSMSSRDSPQSGNSPIYVQAGGCAGAGRGDWLQASACLPPHHLPAAAAVHCPTWPVSLLENRNCYRHLSFCSCHSAFQWQCRARGWWLQSFAGVYTRDSGAQVPADSHARRGQHHLLPGAAVRHGLVAGLCMFSCLRFCFGLAARLHDCREPQAAGAPGGLGFKGSDKRD